MFITGNDSLQYNITGLAPWSVYEVQIAAMTVAQGPWSVVRISRTNESGRWGYVWIGIVCGIANCALVTLLSMNNSVYYVDSLTTFTENYLKGCRI